MVKTFVVEAGFKNALRGILTAAPVRDKFHKAMFHHHLNQHKEHMQAAAKHMHAMENNDPNSKKFEYHQHQALHHLGHAEHHVNMANHHTQARLKAAGYHKNMKQDFAKRVKTNAGKVKALKAANKFPMKGNKPKNKPIITKPVINKRGRPPAFKSPTNSKEPRKNMPNDDTVAKKHQKKLTGIPNKPVKSMNKPINKPMVKPKKPLPISPKSKIKR